MEIVFTLATDTFDFSNVCEPLQTIPLPRIRFLQVVFAQSVPCFPLPTVREGLLVKGSAHIGIDALHARVAVATAIIPKAIVVIQGAVAILHHELSNVLEVISETKPAPTGHEAV